MEPSRKKLSAAVIVLLVLVMAAEMDPVQAGECFTRSTTYLGWCFKSGPCADACMKEGKGYSGGKCRKAFYCYCITPCARDFGAGGRA